MIPPHNETALCDEAEGALKEGNLHLAADLCKSLLTSFPQSARGYYLTASLFQATGNYRKACDYSAVAAELDACVAQYHVQQGQMLYVLKEYAAALSAFEKATKISNYQQEHCLWVAKCLVALERFAEAKGWFARVKEHGGSDAVVAEAQCEMESGDMEAAEKLLADCIAVAPHHAPVHHSLAMLSLMRGDFLNASALLHKTVLLDPRHVEAQFYLALLSAESGDEKKSIDRLLQVLSVDPTHVASLLLLGSLFMKAGDVDSSEKAFAHVLALVPDHVLAWYSMLELLHRHERGREGLQRLSEVATTLDQPVALKHLRTLFGGSVPAAPPREFITAFYAAFTDMFEPWMVAAGDAPHVEYLVKELCALPQMKDKKHLSLLDLGCGTGIVVQKLSTMVSISVGVDISPHMLKIARRTKQYDVLYELDIVDYVLGSETLFDVIVSTGALRWMGNLQPFFTAVRSVMHKDTVLAFMLDKERSTLAYSVANHGRYSHHLSYVCDMAQTEGLQLIAHKEWMHNVSADDTIIRHLFFFKKTTIH